MVLLLTLDDVNRWHQILPLWTNPHFFLAVSSNLQGDKSYQYRVKMITRQLHDNQFYLSNLTH